MFVGGIILGAIVGLDFVSSLLMPKRDPQVLVYGPPSHHVCIVFPGFSNPAGIFGEGMSSILGHDKLILVLDPGTKMDDEQIYQTLWRHIELFVGPVDEFTLYGHSMGGQIGMLFKQRYEREGSKFGPIRTAVLDCSPMKPSSLQAPVPVFLVRLLMTIIWPGVLLRGTIYLGNLLSRKQMPVLHDDSVNTARYKRYQRGIALFNPRAWRAQMLYMLRFKASKVEASEDEIFYIHAETATLDKLVRQIKSIQQWRKKFPNLVLVPAKVSHAWPLEQPGTYRGLFELIWRLPRRGQ